MCGDVPTMNGTSAILPWVASWYGGIVRKAPSAWGESGDTRP